MTDDDLRELAERLGQGICDDKCRVKDAASGCNCASASSAILALMRERQDLYDWKAKAERMDREKTLRIVGAEETIRSLRKRIEVLEDDRCPMMEGDPDKPCVLEQLQSARAELAEKRLARAMEALEGMAKWAIAGAQEIRFEAKRILSHITEAKGE